MADTATPTVFEPKEREKVALIIGGEEVDITRIPMRTLIKVLDLVGTDAENLGMGNYEKTLTAVALVCEPKNEAVTKDFLLDLDAFDEVIPALAFVMAYVNRRAAEFKAVTDAEKNPTALSS